MRHKTFAACLLAPMFWLECGSAFAQSDAVEPPPASPPDQSVYANGTLDVFEAALTGTNSLRWEGEVWVGTFKHRLWLRSEGASNQGSAAATDQLDVLYDHPIGTFVDVQAGLRYDLDAHPRRTWAALGVEGHVPYIAKGWATLYVADGGRAAVWLRGSFDRLLTDRLILQPELQLHLYSRNDIAANGGGDLSNIDGAIRLRYEIADHLSPYVGLTYDRTLGHDARLASRGRVNDETATVVVGISTWF